LRINACCLLTYVVLLTIINNAHIVLNLLYIGGLYMKRVIAFFVIIVMIIAMAPNTVAAGATVYVSVSVDGKLVLAAAPVTITELTIDAALKAAHAAYYPGGESGYKPGGDSDWLFSPIKKAWGINSTPFIIINDSAMASENDYPVADGDNIILSIVSNSKSASTGISMKSVVSGSYTTVTAKSWSENSDFRMESKPVSGAKIINPATGAALGFTNNKGEATVLIPADHIVAVEGLAAINVEKSSSAAPEDDNAGSVPETSDGEATAYISVSIDNKLMLAAAPVKIPAEQTVDAVLKAAHAAYYSGGASGYKSGVYQTYGIYLITKVWGINITPDIVINNTPMGAEEPYLGSVDEHQVKNGDNIIIAIDSDPNKIPTIISMAASVSGNSANITATEWTLSMISFEFSSKPYPNAPIIDPKTGILLGTTDSKGKVTVSIPSSGIVAVDGLAAINVKTRANYKAALSNQAVKVNGVSKALEVYSINGSNYFKLRDIAYLLNGTGSQFSVSYDGVKQAIVCYKGAAYTPDGSELVIGADKSAGAVPSSQSLYIDGTIANLSAYVIGGNNFFKLRDLGTALNFKVDYDETTRTVLITSVAK
jgi:hypothetical protein